MSIVNKYQDNGRTLVYSDFDFELLPPRTFRLLLTICIYITYRPITKQVSANI